MKLKSVNLMWGRYTNVHTAVAEMRASLWPPRKKMFGPVKNLVIGPNDIMVAQTFCDIFFYEKKRHQIHVSIYKQFSD